MPVGAEAREAEVVAGRRQARVVARLRDDGDGAAAGARAVDADVGVGAVQLGGTGHADGVQRGGRESDDVLAVVLLEVADCGADVAEYFGVKCRRGSGCG